MAYNKFIKKDGEVLLDLTGDTVTADKLAEGATAHNASGEVIEGSMKAGESAKLNIAYSENPPSDTSMLWVKSAEPSDSGVIISSNTMNRMAIYTTIGTHPAGKFAESAFAQVDECVYSFGGIIIASDSSTTTRTNRIYKYNMATNTVSQITPSGTTLPYFQGAAAAAVGTNIYIFGGKGGTSTSSADYLSSIYKFDTTTNKLSKLSATLPTRKFAFPAVAVNGYIYLFGGYSSAEPRTKEIYKFNTFSDTITTCAATLFVGEFGHIAFGLPDGSIRIFPGYRTESGVYYVHWYKPSEDKMYYETVALGGTANRRGVTVGNKIYLFLSNMARCHDTKSHRIYNLESPIVENRGHLSSVGYYNGKAYIVGSYYDTDICEVDFTFPLASGNYLVEGNPDITPTRLCEAGGFTIDEGVAAVYRGNSEGYAEAVDAYLYDADSGAWLNIVTGEAAQSLIPFTIDGTQYQAEDGMTWAEWCESEYNTGGWSIAGSASSNYVFNAYSDQYISGSSATATIIDGATYTVASNSSGGIN